MRGGDELAAKKVKVRLNGGPSQKYNFGTKGQQDWKDGGTLLELPDEEAKDLVERKRIATYVDKATPPPPVAPEKRQRHSDVKFDQDQDEPTSE